MHKVEKISKAISDKIAFELELDDERKSVINYGVFAIVQTIISVICILMFGIMFNVAYEAFIISLIMSILRKSSGGIHASSPGRCVTVATIFCVGMALILRKNVEIAIVLNKTIGIIVFIYSYIIICKLAPVDSKAKPIKSAAKKRRLKRNSLVILIFFTIVSFLYTLLFKYTDNPNYIIYNFCVYSGVVWQVFSLTNLGHIVLGKIDELLKYIIF